MRVETSKQTLPFEELKALIQEKQKIIFSDTASKSEVEEANIQLEKLMAEYEKYPEVIAEKEARRALQEKMNSMALEKCMSSYGHHGTVTDISLTHTYTVKPYLDGLTPDQREQLVKEKKVLKLLFMPQEAISKMHQNDFASLVFHKLAIDEVFSMH